jgi:hypothetical protein
VETSNGAEDKMPKIQNLTESVITSSNEDSLNGLPDDIRGECIMAIKTKETRKYAATI